MEVQNVQSPTQLQSTDLTKEMLVDDFTSSRTDVLEGDKTSSRTDVLEGDKTLNNSLVHSIVGTYVQELVHSTHTSHNDTKNATRVTISDSSADIINIETYYSSVLSKHKTVAKQASKMKLTRRDRQIKPTPQQKYDDKLGVNSVAIDANTMSVKNDRHDIMTIDIPQVTIKTDQTIRVCAALHDGGASIDIHNGPVNNGRTKRGTISGWDRSSISTKLTIGTLGKLNNVLSYKGGKDIIVPAHTRNILDGVQVWICPPGMDTHFLVLQGRTGTPGDVLAVWSKATGRVERCTERLMQMLEIPSYALTGVEYIISSSMEGVTITETVDGDAMPPVEMQLNHSMYSSRHGPNPLTSMRSMMAGLAVGSIMKLIKQGSLTGMGWVLPWMVQDEHTRHDHSELKAAFENKRKPSRSLRNIFAAKDIKIGEVLIVDESFFKFKSTTAKSNFKTFNKYNSVLLGVDFGSGYPDGVPLKHSKNKDGTSKFGNTYKDALRKLISRRIGQIQRGAGASKLKYLLMDQHKCQSQQFLDKILDEFNLTLIPARIDSEDMSRLNKVSDTLNKMAHYWIIWSSMDIRWFWYAYKHALLVYPLMGKVSRGRLTGRGFSPFTLWTLIPVHGNFFPPPWGCNVIVKSRPKDSRGGIDTVFVGFDLIGHSILCYFPFSGTTPLRRKSGIFQSMQLPFDHMMKRHIGLPIFDESQLLLGKPVFTMYEPGTIVYFKDVSNQSKCTYNCWIGYDRTPNTRVGTENDKPLICSGCRARFTNWESLRSHVSTMRRKRHANSMLEDFDGYIHPDIHEMPKQIQRKQIKALQNLQDRANYDAVTVAELEKRKDQSVSYRPFYAYGGFNSSEPDDTAGIPPTGTPEGASLGVTPTDIPKSPKCASPGVRQSVSGNDSVHDGPNVRRKRNKNKWSTLPKRNASRRIASRNSIACVSTDTERTRSTATCINVDNYYVNSMDIFMNFEDFGLDYDQKLDDIQRVWSDISAELADDHFESIKDEIRELCAASVMVSDQFDLHYQVNHTNFTPSSEFWRTHLDEDYTDMDILRHDSPYGEQLIGETKFDTGDYKDLAPSCIPCFQPVSIPTALGEVDTSWNAAVAASKYVGEDFLQFTPPECEVNQCEISLMPGVVTGLKFMDSAECQSYLSKLSGANRKSHVPNNSHNALKSPLAPFFIQAMVKELAGISKLGVVSLEPLPKGKKAIPCRFVFDIKWDNSLNRLVKMKARLVAQGFRQREYNQMLGIGSYDPNDISSPVLKLTSLYAITNLCASLPDMGLEAVDVGQAFLAAKLKTDGSEDIFLQLPTVCAVTNDGINIQPEVLKYSKSKTPKHVVKLIKALYGLKNSSKAWFRKISEYLIADGFQQSAEDMCLFTKITTTGSIMLGIHVDDMLITGTRALIATFKRDLGAYFINLGSKITSEDASRPEGVQFLGSVIRKHEDGIVTMSQETRIEDVCKRFKIEIRSNGPTLPYQPGIVSEWQKSKSMPNTDEEREQHVKQIHDKINPEIRSYADVIRNFREYTGCLIWLCGAGCPQVLPIVYKLARYQNSPGISHFIAVRRVLEYLYANKHRPLTFGKQRIQELSGKQIKQQALTIFTDTSHGDCPITKRSTGGYVVFLFGSLLMMRSFRLSCTTTSTTQSEYYMMSAAAGESIYLMQLYNNTLLPFINSILNSHHESLTKIPIQTSKLDRTTMLVSKLSLETIQTLNAKVHPMITEENPINVYGDNSSSILIANHGPKKNSRHSMIHASWLWDLIHQRMTHVVNKIDTKINPADITTKQDGMSAELFEQHTKALLGEMEILPLQVNNVVAHIMEVEGKPMVISILRHSSGALLGLIHNK